MTDVIPGIPFALLTQAQAQAAASGPAQAPSNPIVPLYAELEADVRLLTAVEVELRNVIHLGPDGTSGDVPLVTYAIGVVNKLIWRVRGALGDRYPNIVSDATVGLVSVPEEASAREVLMRVSYATSLVNTVVALHRATQTGAPAAEAATEEAEPGKATPGQYL